MFTAENNLFFILKKRKQENAFRTLTCKESLIDFASNDYLGFARSAGLKEKTNETFHKLCSETSIYNGSTGSRLLKGNTTFAEELERFIASYHYAEAGLMYNSGYDANVGLFSSVPQKEDVVLYDEYIHASVHDGLRLSKAKSYKFSHNNIKELEEKINLLKNSSETAVEGSVFVAVESVYSMDGDFSPLPEIVLLCRKYNAHLIVDEAHATGIFGQRGEGRVVELKLEKNVFARMHTFGKALGCHGGIILGSHVLRDFLINFSRSFIYTTALPLHSLAAVKCAYDILANNTIGILNLRYLIDLFRTKINGYVHGKIIPGDSPIQSIIISGNEKVKSAAVKLQNDGFDIRPILSPTVPKGMERLRICIHSFNTTEEVEKLARTLNILQNC